MTLVANVDTELYKEKDPLWNKINALLENSLHGKVYIFRKSNYGSDVQMNNEQKMINCGFITYTLMELCKS